VRHHVAPLYAGISVVRILAALFLKFQKVPKEQFGCSTRARARAMRQVKLAFQILIHAHTRFARPAVVVRFPITRTHTHTLRPAVVAGIVWKITLTRVNTEPSTVVAVGCGFHRPPRWLHRIATFEIRVFCKLALA